MTKLAKVFIIFIKNFNLKKILLVICHLTYICKEKIIKKKQIDKKSQKNFDELFVLEY